MWPFEARLTVSVEEDRQFRFSPSSQHLRWSQNSVALEKRVSAMMMQGRRLLTSSQHFQDSVMSKKGVNAMLLVCSVKDEGR